MTDYLPHRPIWRRTGATSTTPAAVYLPPGARHVKVWVDVASYLGLGTAYAAPSVTPSDEVYTVFTTGTPTGGTFTLAFDGLETGAIAYNASSTTIITALNALANVDSGDVTGGGGALPTAVTLTAGGVYDATGPLPILKVGTNALTGGTAPGVQIARSTKGTGLGQTAGGYGFLEAESQELLDVAAGPSRAAGAASQARYLYLASVSGTGTYRVTAFVLA